VTFTILLHPKAAKALKKIEKQTRSKITEKLRDLKNHPERTGKRLKHSDFWSLRAGDYCAIYEINIDKNQVIILYIGHRKKVYDDVSKIL